MTTTKATRATDDDNERRYRAPALEKGLDILELLARENAPMTTSQVASSLGRSVSELFRMVLALEFRGYIAPSKGREGYELTNKLFTLGMAQAPTKNLLDAALPVMNELVHQIGQSCHLVVASDDQVVVVARIESPRDLGFSVRVGYRRPLIEATSGLVLFGFQSEDIRTSMLPVIAGPDDRERLEKFQARAAEAAELGYVKSASDFIEGVTDLSVPVMGARGPLAALTVPFVKIRPLTCNQEQAIERQIAAAQKISDQIGDSSR